MHRAVARFVEVIEQDIKNWEQAAQDWRSLANQTDEPYRQNYRNRATAYHQGAVELKTVLEELAKVSMEL